MSLSSPALLIVGLLVAAALGALAVWTGRRRQRALAEAGVASAGRRRQVGAWISIGAVAALALAASGPTVSAPVARRAGTVILAMDVSNSMGAKDVQPTRLAAAQQAARAFIQAQPDTVDIGVVAFEQGALTAARPDADHTLAEAAVNRLAISGGTSLGQAILASLTAITGRTVSIGPDGAAPDIGYWPSATIVIFSDGEDEGRENSTSAAAGVAENAGVHIDTVGVGTAAGSTVDVDGYRLHTALRADTLTSIAQTTGGAYHPASDASQLNDVTSSINLRLTVTKQPLPLAGAVVALALVLLAAGAGLTIYRSGRVI